MAVVDYHSLTRKELQTLCKKHGIPANKKNSFMADALTSILKVDKPNEFGSATPTNLPVGNKSIPSTLKIQNNRGDLTASKVPYGSTFCSLEIQSQIKEPIEEDAIPSTMDTHTDDFTGEKSKREEEKIDDSDTTKTSEGEQFLLHVASTGTADQKEVYHHANQQTEPGPDTPIALYEDVMEELCQQAKFVTRKGDEYSLCCTSNSSLCKDVNDRLDNDTKIYTHDWKTTVDVQKVDHLGQEELCQQVKFVTRKGDEFSLCCTSISFLCKDVNDRLDHDTKIYTHDEQTTVDMQRVDHLDQEKHCQQDKDATRNADEESLHHTSSFSPCPVVNVGDTHEDKTSPDHEGPIHVEGADLLYQEKEIYMKDQKETDIDPALSLSGERLENHNHNDKEKINQGHIDIDAKKMAIDVETVKHDQPSNQSPSCRGNDKEKNGQRHINTDDRKDLSAKEMVIYDEMVKHDQPCNQPQSCRGNDQVKKSMVKIQTAEVSNKSSSFQFFVSCDNGIKLFIDLENSSSSEWMKTHNYEFSFCQELDEQKHCEHSELKSACCPTICKVDVTAENRKVKSDKLTDFQPLTSDFERFSDQNPTTCSSKFLRSQNFGSILPFAFAKKSNVSREPRPTSSFLIPPHGANRGLSTFMTKKSRRLSSTLMSRKNTINVSFSPSAIGDSHKSVSTQVNCSSENSWPIKAAAPSKIQNFSVKLPEKELSLAKYHPNTKTTYSINEPATPHAFVETVSVMNPIKEGCQDVEMLDKDLDNYSTKSPQSKADNEHDFRLAEDYQITDKKVESVAQMNSPHNSQKQMHKKSLLEDFQVEENRIITRYKDEYKKSPFTKCLRGMKNLARATTLRADILARRRGLPLVRNSSGFHNLSYQSENVQGNKSQEEILRVEIGNENGASPEVYHETDLCISSIKREREREDPVIFPSVHEDRYLSVSPLTLGKDPMHNFCNIAMPLAYNGPVITSTSTVLPRDEALQSSTIIIESNPKLSERQYSQVPPLAHQEKLISVYGLIPGKDFLQNIGNISAPLPLAEPVMAHVSTGIDREEERQNNITSGDYNPKLRGRSLLPLAKKRFFEKALAESTERMQAQRTQHNDLNHLSGQMNLSEKVPNNRNNKDYLLSPNLINSCILKTEDGPTEKVSESQTRHQEQLKTPLRGESKEKAMEVAKNKSFVESNENETRNNTGNLLDLNWINSYLLETEDGHNKRVSGRQKRHQEQFKTSLRWNSKEKAVKVAKEMAFVQRNEIINLKRGITTVN